MRKVIRFITSLYVFLICGPIALVIGSVSMLLAILWMFTTVFAYWWLCIPFLNKRSNYDAIQQMLEDGEVMITEIGDLAETARATLVSGWVLLFLRKVKEETPVEESNVVENIVDQMIEIPKK